MHRQNDTDYVLMRTTHRFVIELKKHCTFALLYNPARPPLPNVQITRLWFKKPLPPSLNLSSSQAISLNHGKEEAKQQENQGKLNIRSS